ncbi:MAG: L-histidine N(alpha)-methyltransferase [Anaerolineae bacterium]
MRDWRVRTFAGAHEAACPAIAALPGRRVLLFLGSSIGNYPDDDAIALLAAMRLGLRDDAVLVLGTDLKKDPRVLLPAYDDAQGVTAAFTTNILTRLNREFGCTFRPGRVPARRGVERGGVEHRIFLEAQGPQRVAIGALGRDAVFADGERIHVETCAKYDAGRVWMAFWRGAGFVRAATFTDAEGRYAIQLAGSRG